MCGKNASPSPLYIYSCGKINLELFAFWIMLCLQQIRSHKMRPRLIILVYNIRTCLLVIWVFQTWRRPCFELGLLRLRSVGPVGDGTKQWDWWSCRIRCARTKWGMEWRGGATHYLQFYRTAFVVFWCVTYCSVSLFIKKAKTLSVTRLIAFTYDTGGIPPPSTSCVPSTGHVTVFLSVLSTPFYFTVFNFHCNK